MAITQPVLLKRVGQMNPVSVAEFVALGGFRGLQKALSMTRAQILDEMTDAKLMGRGGAAYPADKKWRQLHAIEGAPKYIVCNADEGEPGTFKDRVLLAQTPLSVIEGMIIAGYLFQSPQGFIYIRGEYRDVQKIFQQALDNAKISGFLGKNIAGVSGFDYEITIVSGAGAYVCGENSALLNSIEGKAGRPRVKPPHLAEVGLYQKPTLVNNVESFACVPIIMDEGGKQFAALGTEYGGGTKLVSVCGQVKHPGTYEVRLGTPLREIICGEEYGGGTASGRPIGFYHLGGQSGPIGFPDQLETPYCYKATRDNGLAIGSGAVVVMDDSVNLVEYLQKVAEFFAYESCGKCTPCRLGVHKLHRMLTDFVEGRAKPGDVDALEAVADHIAMLSACGLGQAVDKALKPCLHRRRADFEALIQPLGGV